ncbi:hypothetical protein BDV93DRAFT_563269 [Ceratobasidium sp. AG-I]|nr:hypothetical protein BDV93DRAFT_563269 [Ceratobasidium sp. AG-I]
MWCDSGRQAGPTKVLDDISMTCGVPSIPKEVERMWIQIQERRRNEQEADETTEASRIISRCGESLENSTESHVLPQSDQNTAAQWTTEMPNML